MVSGARTVAGALSLTRDDVIFASFPRSGSTWLRFIFGNLLAIESGIEEAVDFHYVDSTMPALGNTPLVHSWSYVSLPRLVKTHQPYRRLLFARTDRAVYVERDPRDIAVSYYHFARANALHAFKGSFQDFLRHPRFGLEASIHHHRSWSKRNPIMVTYERLLADPVTEVTAVLRTLGSTVPVSVVEEAVARSTLHHLREAQSRTGIPGATRFSKDFQFARSGADRAWVKMFTPADVEYYELLRRRHRFTRYE